MSTFFAFEAAARAQDFRNQKLRADAKAAEALKNEVTANLKTEEARKNLEQAEQNAVVAREQSQLALKLLQSVIFDIQRKLNNVPGAGDLQRALLQTSLARLQEVSDQFAFRGAIDRNTAAALTDLGDVFLRIGTESRMGTPARPSDGTSESETDRAWTGKSAHPTPPGPLAAARKVYQQAFDIAAPLAAADPTDAQAQCDLWISYSKLGDVSRQAGQVTQALGHYQKALEISQKLAAADPKDAQAQRDLIISHVKLGQVHRTAKAYTQSVESFEAALKIAGRLKTEGKLAGEIDRLIEALESDRKQIEVAATALGDWKTLLDQPADLLSVLLEMRGVQFVQDGRVADAVQSIAKLRELKAVSADQLYNVACVYCLCATAIKPEKGEALTADQVNQRDQYIAHGLESLREAIKAGYKDFAHMQKDTDLAPLHGLPEFKALVSKWLWSAVAQRVPRHSFYSIQPTNQLRRSVVGRNRSNVVPSRLSCAKEGALS